MTLRSSRKSGRKYADSERSRSSMEALLLTCLQAQFLIKRVEVTNLTPKQKNDLIWEVKQIAPKKCNIDAKADGRNAL